MGIAFKAVAIQMRSGADPQVNAVEMERLVREAAAMGATYIQTPEMTGVVQKSRDKLNAVVTNQNDDITVRTAARLAGELGIHLHIGSTAIRTEKGGIANRAFFFGPDGALIATYDKIHMFDVDLDNGESWRESAVYSAGDRSVVVQSGLAAFGLAICYDLRFPHIFRDQAMAGADILTVPAAFTRQTGEKHWRELLRARAIENGAWVIAAAQGGLHEDGRETFGHSLVADPSGAIVAELDNDEPGMLVADIDPDLSQVARGKIPNLKNGRGYELDVVDATERFERRAS